MGPPGLQNCSKSPFICGCLLPPINSQWCCWSHRHNLHFCFFCPFFHRFTCGCVLIIRQHRAVCDYAGRDVCCTDCCCGTGMRMCYFRASIGQPMVFQPFMSQSEVTWIAAVIYVWVQNLLSCITISLLCQLRGDPCWARPRAWADGQCMKLTRLKGDLLVKYLLQPVTNFAPKFLFRVNT